MEQWTLTKTKRHIETGGFVIIQTVAATQTREQAEARARLAVAAPDLLEALSDLVQALDFQMGWKAVTLRIALAVDAIAKATGTK